MPSAKCGVGSGTRAAPEWIRGQGTRVGSGTGVASGSAGVRVPGYDLEFGLQDLRVPRAGGERGGQCGEAMHHTCLQTLVAAI